MNNFIQKIHYIFLFLFSLFFISSHAYCLDLSPNEMAEILKISKNISLAKPSLSDSKKLEYAVGIFKASKRFSISSNLLISIAAQETSFREELPEGKAGEFGIVQIRKIWVRNSKLRRYFKNAKIKDLNNPEKAFLYAAWILRDLKDNAPKSSIPFWSFYNARGFQPRFRYFLSINQKLSYLNKGVPFTRDVADNIQINGSANQKSWQPDVRLLAALPQIAVEIPTVKTYEKPNSKNNLITTASLGSGIVIENNGWVEKALKRLERESVKSRFLNLAVPVSTAKVQKSNQLAFSKTAAKLLKSITD